MKTLILSSLAVAGVLAAPAAEPQVSFGSASGVVAGQCTGQSCVIADLAGTTGNLPDHVAEGGDAAGLRCIEQMNPEGYAAATKNGVPQQAKGFFGGLFGRSPLPQFFGSSNAYTGSCSSNILIFAKGTTEIGALGSTVGPLLSARLTMTGFGRWSVQGVSYSADNAGNNCVGLPGGMIAKELLESAHAKCPNSNLYTSGYSQGAMVARIAVAYANDSTKAAVKGVLTFGDPFNGAKIKGYNGPIKVLCKESDAVCTGAFKIGTAHLTYAFTDVGTGASWLTSQAR